MPDATMGLTEAQGHAMRFMHNPKGLIQQLNEFLRSHRGIGQLNEFLRSHRGIGYVVEALNGIRWTSGCHIGDSGTWLRL
jgi:hypothetical protein